MWMIFFCLILADLSFAQVRKISVNPESTSESMLIILNAFCGLGFIALALFNILKIVQ